mmetsp:Transcript_73893/g.153952  ORF Transcript_73893/g.153952 Transcript_73893/m.153952 type:complete len:161 (+) Transcript_73893:82-564(+)
MGNHLSECYSCACGGPPLLSRDEVNAECAAPPKHERQLIDVTHPGLTRLKVDKRWGGRLGIDVDPTPDLAGLLIVGFSDGLLRQWNDDHPSRHIKVGDIIIEVNGIKHDVEEMVTECSRSKRLELVIEMTSANNMPCDECQAGWSNSCQVPCIVQAAGFT